MSECNVVVRSYGCLGLFQGSEFEWKMKGRRELFDNIGIDVKLLEVSK